MAVTWRVKVEKFEKPFTGKFTEDEAEKVAAQFRRCGLKAEKEKDV